MKRKPSTEPVTEVPISIMVSPEIANTLRRLLDTGYFGRNMEQVVEEIVIAGVRRFILDGWLNEALAACRKPRRKR